MDKLGPVEIDFIFNNAEFKAASEQLKSEIQGIVTVAKDSAVEASAATTAVLSDSAKEIAEYQRQIAESGKMSGPLVESKGIEEAKRQLELLVAEKVRLQEFYDTGKMGAESYQLAVDKLAASERQLTAAVAGTAPNQQGAEVKILDEKQRALEAVSDEYRGVLAAGMAAYNELTPATRTLIVQLNDMDGEMRQVNLAQNDLNKRFDAGTVDATQYTQALAALSVREAELRKNIQGSTNELKGQSMAIGAQKPQWNGLGNSINQVTRELPAFTYSAQTGFMAISNNIPILVDEINRLKVTNAAAAAAGAATIPVWTAIKAALFSWMTVISLLITVFTVFGKEIVGFIGGLFKASGAIDDVTRAQEAMKEAFKGSEIKNAISDLSDLRSNLELAKKGLIDQTTVIEQYNESIGKVSREVKTLAEVEKGLINNADNYVKATLYKATADAAREKVAKDMLELAEKQLKAEEDLAKAQAKEAVATKYNFEGGRGVGSSLQIAQAERRALENEVAEGAKAIEELNGQGSKLIQKLKEQSLATGLDLFSDESQFNKITADINKVNEQYANAGLERKEKEIQTVKDKYAKLRTEAEKFNADPKNKANLIDVSELDSSEKAAIDAIKAKQSKEKGTKEVDDRKSLLSKIADIDAEYARKSFTKDEAEIQGIRDKFSKVRVLVERFNADPKNRAKRIDLTGLGELEEGAVADVTFRQETAVMAAEISAQKKLFADFEEYKLKFGTEKAKEAYGDQIGEYESYMDYLRSLIDSNQDTYTAITTGDATGGQSERYKMLEKVAEEENTVQRKKDEDLELANQSHKDRMLVIEQNYLATRKQLQEAGRADDVAILDQKHDAEVKNLETAELKKTEAYKRVFSTVRAMTIKNTKELIGQAEILLENEKLTGDERIKIEQKIADLKALINRGTLESIYKIAGALGALGQSLSELGDSSSGIAQVGKLMSGLASGVGDLLTVLDKESSDADKIASGINGLVKIVGMLSSAAKQRKEAEADYYSSVIGFQNDYNLSLNEQLRLQSMIGESVFLNDYEARIKDGLSALKDANEQYQDSLAALSGGQAKTGQKNAVDWGNVGQGAAAGAALGAAVGTVVPIIGNAVGLIVGGLIGGLAGLFGGKKKKDTFVPLLEEYNELIQIGEDGVSRLNRELAETLIANNLVDDSTKQQIEDVLAWEDAVKAAKDQIDSVIADLVGQLGNDVRNSLVDAFRNGEDAAVAMGKTVEKVLEDMVSQIIFNKIFADQFKSLQDDMKASYDPDVGDGNWVDDFERFFEASKGLSEEFNQALKDAQASAAASGFDLFKPEGTDKKKEGIQGGIERITEQTGTELTGILRSLYDLVKRNSASGESLMVVENQHYAATLEGLNYWASIDRNTAKTVDKLDEAVVELKNIVKNTKGGDIARDNGYGDI